MTVESLVSPLTLTPLAGDNDAGALRLIEELTRNADSVQEKVLAEILSRNGETEYLRQFKLGGSTDREKFKSTVPVVGYDDLEPYIRRIANGDFSPILSSHPISEFFTSSGTSAGERKLMPTIDEEMNRRQMLYNLLMPVMNLYVPGLDKGKALYFLFTKVGTKTRGGLLARPVLTSYYNSDQFKNKPHNPYTDCTSPIEAILCVDSFQSMYAQMLCGLLMRDHVLRVGAVFASGLLRAIRFLQVYWRELAHDISSGTLSSEITDLSIRNSINKILRPNAVLARLIIKECQGENWEGIIKRIWPNTKYLEVVVTGAMAQYIHTLDYYSGGLPKASVMYASSECYFGLNLNPMCEPADVSYTIMPNMGYFEFLPHDSLDPLHVARGQHPHLVDLVDVQLGKEYELVITTYSGLCRYRVGDILQVSGFHNSAPMFKFVRRKNVLLSIDSDKTDEAELQGAINNATSLLHEYETRLVEYTSYAHTNDIPGHYVVYWELESKDLSKYPKDDVLNKCCLMMEESMNTVYRQCRVADNSIGPLEIKVVKSGTFEEVMDLAISRGASINQYKTPRCVNVMPIVELLNSRVVSTHFSPSPPHWTPERRI
ncbi:unnamed protein product [Cuscuta europaea]|uniref:Uncharacterized protein n=1 Tax=Cuscuta europaea TaxID=41803 RepID=A0A9P0Z9T3_CUSEU|nr:unnamed protein product [Cuscuta europaea]